MKQDDYKELDSKNIDNEFKRRLNLHKDEIDSFKKAHPELGRGNWNSSSIHAGKLVEIQPTDVVLSTRDYSNESSPYWNYMSKRAYDFCKFDGDEYSEEETNPFPGHIRSAYFQRRLNRLSQILTLALEHLTKQQQEVIKEVRIGTKQRKIARKLGITEQAVSDCKYAAILNLQRICNK